MSKTRKCIRRSKIKERFPHTLQEYDCRPGSQRRRSSSRINGCPSPQFCPALKLIHWRERGKLLCCNSATMFDLFCLWFGAAVSIFCSRQTLQILNRFPTVIRGSRSRRLGSLGMNLHLLTVIEPFGWFGFTSKTVRTGIRALLLTCRKIVSASNGVATRSASAAKDGRFQLIPCKPGTFPNPVTHSSETNFSELKTGHRKM